MSSALRLTNLWAMRQTDNLLKTWLLATFGGWLLGFVLLVILAEIWSATGTEAQFPVGVGLGAGVGYMQSRKVGVVSSRRWLWVSIVGMGTPFVAWDISTWAGINVPYPLQLFTLIGALLTGILQAMSLRQHYPRGFWWIPACVVGWGFPASLAALENAGVLPLIGILFGGIVLGAITGISLLWISKGAGAEH